jgi:hypothetical protein
MFNNFQFIPRVLSTIQKNENYYQSVLGLMVFLSSAYEMCTFGTHKLYGIRQHFGERQAHHNHDVKLIDRANDFSITVSEKQEWKKRISYYTKFPTAVFAV